MVAYQTFFSSVRIFVQSMTKNFSHRKPKNYVINECSSCQGVMVWFNIMNCALSVLVVIKWMKICNWLISFHFNYLPSIWVCRLYFMVRNPLILFPFITLLFQINFKYFFRVVMSSAVLHEDYLEGSLILNSGTSLLIVSTIFTKTIDILE